MKSLEKGQGLTEYAVLLSLVAVAAIATMAFFGGSIKARIASLASAVAGQSVSEVESNDKISKKSANEAGKNAKNVEGNLTVGKEDIFDKQGL